MTVTIETGFRETLTGYLWTAGGRWMEYKCHETKQKESTPWEILCFDYPLKISQII